MGFFRMGSGENKLRYKWVHEYKESHNADIKDWLNYPLHTNKCPIKKVKTFVGGVKNMFESCFISQKKFLTNVANEDPDRSTIRTCWGVNKLFSNSLVYTSPCDIAISYNDKQDIVYNIPGQYGFEVTKHPLEQTEYDGGNLLQDRIFLKFVPQFLLNSPYDYCFMNPTWHSSYTPWRVVSGIVRSGVMKPALFLELPIIDSINHLEIKRGDVLAYLYFMGDVDTRNLIHDESLKETSKTRFTGF